MSFLSFFALFSFRKEGEWETEIEFIPLLFHLRLKGDKKEKRDYSDFFHCFFEFRKRRKWKCLRPLFDVFSFLKNLR